MISFAEKVIAYTDGMDRQRFIASGLDYEATLRNLELIGEAATHAPDSVHVAYPQIPWRLVIAARNRLIQGYPRIDNGTVWSIAVTDVPTFIRSLRSVATDSSRMRRAELGLLSGRERGGAGDAGCTL